MASSSTSSSPPSSENKCLPSSSLVDTWISQASARDSDALIRALRSSLLPSATSPPPPIPYNNPSTLLVNAAVDPRLSTPTNPNDNDNDNNNNNMASKVNDAVVLGPRGKVAKRRKSRASSKRTNTTFIAADAAHFREMVQQVTGVKFHGEGGGDHCGPPVILKPAPQRLGNSRLVAGGGGAGASGCGGLLPTLDTSAFLMSPVSANSSVGPGLGPNTGPITHQENFGAADFGVGLDFVESLATAATNYPTLDSFKVVM